jgi:hypothetical protein
MEEIESLPAKSNRSLLRYSGSFVFSDSDEGGSSSEPVQVLGAVEDSAQDDEFHVKMGEQGGVMKSAETDGGKREGSAMGSWNGIADIRRKLLVECSCKPGWRRWCTIQCTGDMFGNQGSAGNYFS